jgi:hypothetical protein
MDRFQGQAIEPIGNIGSSGEVLFKVKGKILVPNYLSTTP